jgi:hypothetical protein
MYKSQTSICLSDPVSPKRRIGEKMVKRKNVPPENKTPWKWLILLTHAISFASLCTIRKALLP